jgi:hypothetical protein
MLKSWKTVFQITMVNNEQKPDLLVGRCGQEVGLLFGLGFYFALVSGGDN